MIATRIAAGFVTLGLALTLATYPVRARGAQPVATATPDASGTDAGEPSATPSPTPTPRHRVYITPAPLHRRSPSPSPTPSAIPTASPTPAPSPTRSPRPAKTPRPTPSPKPTATPTPVPTATLPPTPAPTPTLSPTPHPTATPRPTPTPRPTRTPVPSAIPSLVPPAIVTPSARARRRPLDIVPSAMPASSTTPAVPVRPGPTDTPPTPIPTLGPTPRPIAPVQPTVPQAMNDPNVAGMIARPIRELSSFGWMSGTWRAHNVQQLPDGKARDLGLNTYVFAFTMKNRWLFGADGKAIDEFYITYDPFARHYVLVRLEGNPSYGIWVSGQGWRGNTIAFTSTFSYANGRQYHRRITIIHKDARTFGIYDEEELPDGSWTADDAVELTKQQ